jgi:hypothetical protein
MTRERCLDGIDDPAPPNQKLEPYAVIGESLGVQIQLNASDAKEKARDKCCSSKGVPVSV